MPISPPNLPPSEDPAGDPNDYAATVGALSAVNTQISAVNATLTRIEEQAQRAEATAGRAVPRDELRRRLMLALGIMVVLLVAFVVTGVMTFRAYQRDLSTQVADCFIGPGRNNPQQVNECDRRFQGYRQAQKRSATITKQFNDLVAEIPRNKQRIGELERQVAELTGNPPSTDPPQ